MMLSQNQKGFRGKVKSKRNNSKPTKEKLVFVNMLGDGNEAFSNAEKRFLKFLTMERIPNPDGKYSRIY